MGRLIRFLAGVALLLIGGALLIRYGETAFLSLYGDRTDAKVVAACHPNHVLLVPTAPRCPASWGGSAAGAHTVVGAVVAPGGVVSVRIVFGHGYAQPSGADATLGYIAPVLIAIGFGLAVARGSRASDGG